MSLPPRALVLRDLTVWVTAAAVWWLDGRLRASGSEAGTTGLVVGAAAGVLAAVCGFFAHEYGHLAGSLLTGAKVSYPRGVLTTLFFHFDSAQNDRRQFFAMSFGGYLATVVLVGLMVLLLPLDALSGRVALGLAGLGMVVTFVLEVPITVRVWRGAPLPLGVAYRPYADGDVSGD